MVPTVEPTIVHREFYLLTRYILIFYFSRSLSKLITTYILYMIDHQYKDVCSDRSYGGCSLSEVKYENVSCKVDEIHNECSWASLWGTM